MGPKLWRKSWQACSLGSGLVCVLLAGFGTAMGQADEASSGQAQTGQTATSGTTGSAQVPSVPAIRSLSGTVLDATGAPVPGATVKLTGQTGSAPKTVTTGENGWFSFGDVAPGSFELAIELTGFKTKMVTGTLPASEGYLVPTITLELAPVITDISVRLTTEEIATEQLKQQEQQKLIGIIPNFYASYVQDAAPLTPKQKFGLAWKQVIDPANIVISAMIAGGQQANNSFPGYGQGAAGYANRFGAAYGDFFIGTYVSSAILPSILKQDPRYFYKGTGTIKSRIWYAISRSVITKGDNGRWQPDYSGIGGSLVSGAISNLYYPEGSQHGFNTTMENTLIGIGTSAGVNILQEFVFPKFTPKLPKHVPGLGKHDDPKS